MITPVPYAGTGSQSQIVLGHYSVAQLSGLIAATPTALDPHASIRWAPTVSSYLMTLNRLKVGYAVSGAITAAVTLSYQAIIARGFTVDYVTGSTAINMATVLKTGVMRNTMSNSQLGTAGPRITTTGAMSGHTNTLDSAPFATTVWKAITSTNSTGTAVLLNLGEGGPMTALYEWTGHGQHPLVLGANEGVVVRITNTGHASGTLALYTTWEWAESLQF